MNWNQDLQDTLYSHCPLRHYSHKPRSKDLNVYLCINEWRKRVYVYNGISLGSYKGILSYATKTDNLTKWNKPVTEGQILHDGTFVSSQVDKLIEERRIVVARGWKWVWGRCCLMGLEFQLCKVKKFLEICCTILCI